MRLWLLALGGCIYAYPDDTAVPPAEEAPVAVAALWDGTAPSGRLTLEPVVIISGRSTTGTSAYAQVPGGGPRSGLRIEIPTLVGGFPPPIGTPVQLTGTWYLGREAPRLVVDQIDDVALLGPAHAPSVTTAETTDDLGGSLVRAAGLTVVSGVDPMGFADTDARVRLGGVFSVTPGFQSAGDAIGVITDLGVLSLRRAGDWSGPLDGEPPLAATTADLHSGAVDDGSWIQLTAVTQVAPWSQDGRWTVVQDADGVGVWVDTEAWSVRPSLEGDQLTWVGEARRDPTRLRTWVDPVVVGEAVPVRVDTWDDGDLVELAITVLGEPADDGSRLTDDDLRLDPTFADLDALQAPAIVTGVVRDDGELRLAVIRW